MLCQRSPLTPWRCHFNLQAKNQLLRRNAQQLLQRLDLGCCPDCPRVHQREAASLQAMAAWHEELEQVSTLRLQALEQGRPYPPLTLPCLDLQPFLPEGLPEDFPPSIDRCAACQNRLEEVRLQWAGRLQEQRLAGSKSGASAAGMGACCQQQQPGTAAGQLSPVSPAAGYKLLHRGPLLFTPACPFVPSGPCWALYRLPGLCSTFTGSGASGRQLTRTLSEHSAASSVPMFCTWRCRHCGQQQH